MITFDTAALRMVAIPRDAAEKLLAAPPACAKVYLYGLVRQKAEIDEMAAELRLSKNQVQEAVDALLEAGLWASEGAAFSYALPAAECRETNPALYEDAAFNAMLQALFTDRELSYQEYQVFYECIDVYGLPKPVVLMLAEYMITLSRAKNRVSIAAIRDKAREWAREGVDTIERAQERMEEGGSNADAVRQILKALKIRRLPTDEEEKLYDKWVREWGFSFGGIMAATAAMTKVQYPNMKYLDGILKNLHRQGKLTAKDINEHFARTEETGEAIKELLMALGAPRLTITAEAREKYMKWKNMGFSQGALCFACAYAARQGAANLEYVDKLLIGWASKKLFSEEGIQEYLAAREEKRGRIQAMLEQAGLKKQVTRGDEAVYDRFTGKYGMNDEVIGYAAQCACGLAAPLKAMEKMLSRWQAAGVKSLADARREDEAFRAFAGKDGRKGNPMMERNYTLEELRGKIKDSLEEMEEQDGGNPV